MNNSKNSFWRDVTVLLTLSGSARNYKWTLGVILFGVLILAIGVAFKHFGFIDDTSVKILSAASGAITALLIMIRSIADAVRAEKHRDTQVDFVERQRLEHPEKPQLAWDLARIKLENYLDRNLSQVRSIFWLTLLVMGAGFGVVMYGLVQASQNPEKLPVSIVAAGSGVLISFIGGSFLIIYRSILAQSRGYVSVLERINAVGMAIQVISNIPDSGAELKHKATAELARQLLGLYANQASPPPSRETSGVSGSD